MSRANRSGWLRVAFARKENGFVQVVLPQPPNQGSENILLRGIDDVPCPLLGENAIQLLEIGLPRLVLQEAEISAAITEALAPINKVTVTTDDKEFTVTDFRYACADLSPEVIPLEEPLQ